MWFLLLKDDVASKKGEASKKDLSIAREEVRFSQGEIYLSFCLILG